MNYTKADLIADVITAVALTVQLETNYSNGFDLKRDGMTLLGTFLVRFLTVFSTRYMLKNNLKKPDPPEDPKN